MDLQKVMNEMLGETRRDTCTGKKVQAHGRTWILIHQVTPKLFLAVESGHIPPCDVSLIKCENVVYIT